MNYIIIRVKEKESAPEKSKKTEGRTSKRETTKRKAKRHWGSSLLDHDSSVEVGYGLFLCYR